MSKGPGWLCAQRVCLCICPRLLGFKCPLQSLSLRPLHLSLPQPWLEEERKSSYVKSHSSITAIRFTKKKGERGRGKGERGGWGELVESG